MVKNHPAWTKSVIRVGDGRGFVVEGTRESRYVITAAHCLPHPPGGFGNVSHTQERIYAALLGAVGKRSKSTVCAKCLFFDPVADVAVLGDPDSQELWEENAAYEALVGAARPLQIDEPTMRREVITLSTGTIQGPLKGECAGWLLSLDNRWFRCDLIVSAAAVLIENAAEHIVGGVSGSPIVMDDAAAIGIVCSGDGIGQFNNFGQPHLIANLPGWLLRQLKVTVETKGGRYATARAALEARFAPRTAAPG